MMNRTFLASIVCLLLFGTLFFFYSEYSVLQTTGQGTSSTVVKVVHSSSNDDGDDDAEDAYVDDDDTATITLEDVDHPALEKLDYAATVALQQQQHGRRTFVHTPADYKYLLQKPFYVYEPLIWFDSTIDGQPILNLLETNFTDKHADDLWFMASALSHPMRTFDPQEASLFVVPTLGSQAVSTNVEYCWQNRCGLKLLRHAEAFLRQSPWFARREGADHIFVATDWMAPRVMHKFPILQQCHMIVIENRQYNNPNRFAMPSYYMGSPCPPADNSNKTGDFVMVATLRPKGTDRKTFANRRHMCHWMSKHRPQYKVPVCGPGQQCPALAQSKFGFHVRGDSFGANRLMDTILSETVPVFTQYMLKKTLPDWIDWDQLAGYAPVNNQDKFLTALDELLADQEQYERKLAAVRANKILFEWRSGVPFDTYMFMLNWHLEAASSGVPPNSPTTPYSALRMPTDKGFGVFQSSTKRVWCGIGGMAVSCDQCHRGKPTFMNCRASCHWCKRPIAQESIVNGTTTTRKVHCVPQGQQCRQA